MTEKELEDRHFLLVEARRAAGLLQRLNGLNDQADKGVLGTTGELIDQSILKDTIAYLHERLVRYERDCRTKALS